jgi:hypothetical protein
MTQHMLVQPTNDSDVSRVSWPVKSMLLPFAATTIARKLTSIFPDRSFAQIQAPIHTAKHHKTFDIIVFHAILCARMACHNVFTPTKHVNHRALVCQCKRLDTTRIGKPLCDTHLE